MSIHVPGFQSFFKVFLHPFVLAKLATHSIRVNPEPALVVCSISVYYSCVHISSRSSLLLFSAVSLLERWLYCSCNVPAGARGYLLAVASIGVVIYECN